MNNIEANKLKILLLTLLLSSSYSTALAEDFKFCKTIKSDGSINKENAQIIEQAKSTDRPYNFWELDGKAKATFAFKAKNGGTVQDSQDNKYLIDTLGFDHDFHQNLKDGANDCFIVEDQVIQTYEVNPTIEDLVMKRIDSLKYKFPAGKPELNFISKIFLTEKIVELVILGHTKNYLFRDFHLQSFSLKTPFSLVFNDISSVIKIENKGGNELEVYHTGSIELRGQIAAIEALEGDFAKGTDIQSLVNVLFPLWNGFTDKTTLKSNGIPSFAGLVLNYCEDLYMADRSVSYAELMMTRKIYCENYHHIILAMMIEKLEDRINDNELKKQIKEASQNALNYVFNEFLNKVPDFSRFMPEEYDFITGKVIKYSLSSTQSMDVANNDKREQNKISVQVKETNTRNGADTKQFELKIEQDFKTFLEANNNLSDHSSKPQSLSNIKKPQISKDLSTDDNDKASINFVESFASNTKDFLKEYICKTKTRADIFVNWIKSFIPINDQDCD